MGWGLGLGPPLLTASRHRRCLQATDRFSLPDARDSSSELTLRRNSSFGPGFHAKHRQSSYLEQQKIRNNRKSTRSGERRRKHSSLQINKNSLKFLEMVTGFCECKKEVVESALEVLPRGFRQSSEFDSFKVEDLMHQVREGMARGATLSYNTNPNNPSPNVNLGPNLNSDLRCASVHTWAPKYPWTTCSERPTL